MLKQKLNLAVFLAVIACFVAIVTLFPRDERTVERENRALNRLPEISIENIFSGGFARDFEPYLSDRVGCRASVVTLAKNMEYARGLGQNAIRVSNGTLILPDRLMEIFTANAEAGARYSDVLSAYRDAVGDNVRVFSLLAPTQIEFAEERYRTISDPQYDAVRNVYARLEKAGVVTVDAYAAIEEHAGEYVYFRTDHHWTALGAYYAYTAFSGAAGFEPLPLSDFEYNSAAGFLGYLYNREPVRGMATDTIEWYKHPDIETADAVFYPPRAGEKVTYGVFLGGDHDKYVIETGLDTGKTAVIIKDSYANAFIPWLVPHYDTIVVLDPREFEGSACDIVAEYESADLIFVNYVFSTTFYDFIQMLENMR
ncbi:MAG: hypothetical protein GX823_06940 [Clostridiales bacterium]|nr:hypothetical protein [Clostridiales bacterium]